VLAISSPDQIVADTLGLCLFAEFPPICYYADLCAPSLTPVIPFHSQLVKCDEFKTGHVSGRASSSAEFFIPKSGSLFWQLPLFLYRGPTEAQYDSLILLQDDLGLADMMHQTPPKPPFPRLPSSDNVFL